MKAVVLVGGFGTRLRPLTFTRPKQMLPVVGVTMIERVLAHLAEHGVDEAVLSLGYRPDAFIEAFPSGVVGGVRVTYAVESEPLDTAGAIRFAALEAGIDERFLAVNGDVLTDLDVSALVGFHRASGAEGTLYLTPVDDPSHYGVVPTDDDGRVLAFIEKPAPGEAPTNLINGGYYVLEASVLDRIPAGRPVNIERETFPEMAAAGVLYAKADRSYWLDVGTPERYLQASLDLLSGVRAEPVTTLDAHVGEGKVVASHLGADVQVARGAVVSRSVLGDGAVVEADAIVEDSVLLAGARVGEGAIVIHSVLGADAAIGATAHLSAHTVVGDRHQVPHAATASGGRLPELEPTPEEQP